MEVADMECVFVHPKTNQLMALMTIIRDRDTRRADWIFYADRVIRLVVEHALNFLPVAVKKVNTPVDEATYSGLAFLNKIVGVSIIRGGEAMENALRSCCRNIRIGKILIQRDESTATPEYYYSKLPEDIHERHVLLLDPMLATGGSLLTAIRVLLDSGVREEKIIAVTVIAAADGIRAVTQKHPLIRIVTAEVDEHLNDKKYIVPGCGDFGDRYFGTEN
uniref:uracil phosphoribosyltransferase n=2 Tax=Rhodosorus marinus TaxID=101924 RepID=A0A7S2ZZY2_9RHOD|mmetsp:Transcript_39430/g.156565  ORF Transcript_39430/g.156565 Transcript_39430/m.156565 type:complete len:220 (+) Transcript_39430:141-800(+)